MAKLPKKYEKGSAFATLDEAFDWMDKGYYFWWHDRPYHPSFLTSWQFRMFASLVRNGQITRAKFSSRYITAAVDHEVAKMEASYNKELVA